MRRLVIVAGAWLLAAGAGFLALLDYAGTPGPAGKPIACWPGHTQVHFDPARANLVMLAHPHCPCTRASVEVLCDDQGHEIRGFGATTSGQILLYSAGGELLFNGGITVARGHAGDNAGQDAVIAWLTGRPLTPGEGPKAAPRYAAFAR